MQKLRHLFFSWENVEPFLGNLLHGFLLTLEVTFASFALALVGALILATMRQARTANSAPAARLGTGLVRGAAVTYIDLFRGLPALLVIIVFYVSLPAEIDAIKVGILALMLVYAAYLAEILRAGIESIDRGQVEAARSLGMSAGQSMRRIVLPQAFRRVLPPLMNEFIILSKDTALLSVIAVPELLGSARDAQSITFNSSPLIAAGIGYLLFTLPLTRLLDHYIARERRQHGGGTVVIP